jgi:hypothetical protein
LWCRSRSEWRHAANFNSTINAENIGALMTLGLVECIAELGAVTATWTTFSMNVNYQPNNYDIAREYRMVRGNSVVVETSAQ